MSLVELYSAKISNDLSLTLCGYENVPNQYRLIILGDSGEVEVEITGGSLNQATLLTLGNTALLMNEVLNAAIENYNYNE